MIPGRPENMVVWLFIFNLLLLNHDPFWSEILLAIREQLADAAAVPFNI